MGAISERELKVRVTDLENALRVIGDILVDDHLPTARRIMQVQGILRMYVESAAPAAAAETGPFLQQARKTSA